MSTYSKRVPCSNCPFRKVGGIPLAAARVAEIVHTEGEFPCHKTTASDDDGERYATDDSVVCAGFLIFREKTIGPNQLMRIAERMRLYDASALMDKANQKAVDAVFDSEREMAQAGRKRKRPVLLSEAPPPETPR